MFNLSYGDSGQKVKLGTQQSPGIKKRKKLSKKAKRMRLANKKSALKYIEKLELIPVLNRLAYLKKQLDRGIWAPKFVQDKKRAEFEIIKYKLLPLEGKICYTCGTVPTIRHHIVPICRSGTNVPMNLVPLCKHCHSKLHPWLNEELDIPSSDNNCDYMGTILSTVDKPSTNSLTCNKSIAFDCSVKNNQLSDEFVPIRK